MKLLDRKGQQKIRLEKVVDVFLCMSRPLSTSGFAFGDLFMYPLVLGWSLHARSKEASRIGYPQGATDACCTAVESLFYVRGQVCFKPTAMLAAHFTDTMAM